MVCSFVVYACKKPEIKLKKLNSLSSASDNFEKMVMSGKLSYQREYEDFLVSLKDYKKSQLYINPQNKKQQEINELVDEISGGMSSENIKSMVLSGQFAVLNKSINKEINNKESSSIEENSLNLTSHNIDEQECDHAVVDFQPQCESSIRSCDTIDVTTQKDFCYLESLHCENIENLKLKKRCETLFSWKSLYMSLVENNLETSEDRPIIDNNLETGESLSPTDQLLGKFKRFRKVTRELEKNRNKD